MADLEEGIPNTRLGQAVIRIRENLKAFIGSAPVVHRVGEKWLKRHDEQRRIVWVVRPSTITRPERTTGGAFASGAEAERTTPTRTRHEHVHAYIQAEDQAAVEALMDALIAALELSYSSECDPLEYDWETQQRPGVGVDEHSGAGHMLWAERIRLDVVFRWLVLKERSPLFVVTSFEHGC